MSFRDPKEINTSQNLLYRAGDIAICPVCRTEHFEVARDIFQGDHIVESQIRRIPGVHIGEKPNDYCHFCFGGNQVCLVPLMPRMLVKD